MTTDLGPYDYALPREQIAQTPAAERDGARLLVLDRAGGGVEHAEIRELPRWLEPGDLLVVNATRVLPARLRGHKESGGAAEALVLGPLEPGSFRALVRCRGRLKPGLKLRLSGLDAEVTRVEPDGEVVLRLAGDPYAVGEMPLPPYIRRPQPVEADRERYQTTYARVPGSVAAPTAGLHLSHALLERLAERGVERAEVVLHVGAGTFRPVAEAQLRTGTLHSEPFELPEATASAVEAARAEGRRVVAVGTTVTRVLETCMGEDGRLVPGQGATRLFLRPGADGAAIRFGCVDALLTNFHLPRSSLLLLVAAFAGRDRVLAAYAEAVARGYRFFSYGDAMLLR